MSDELALPGRCNAETANGPCRGHPVKGGTRCYMHGGRSQLYAARLAALDEKARAEITDALEDPDLLDVRRPIALLEQVVNTAAVVPSEKAVRKHARAKLIKAFDGNPEALVQILGDSELRAEFLEPDEEDLQLARLELHGKTAQLVERYAKRQTAAVKAMEWSRVIRETALPLFGELGLRISRVLRRHIPEEKLPAIISEIADEMRLVLGELANRRDKP